MASSIRIADRHATLLGRVRLGKTGVAALELPEGLFSAAITSALTSKELAATHVCSRHGNALIRGRCRCTSGRRRRGGLMVPTYDDTDRFHYVSLQRFENKFHLRGDWYSLALSRGFNSNTIISLWYYRDFLPLSPIIQQLMFVVRSEQTTEENVFCNSCGHNMQHQH